MHLYYIVFDRNLSSVTLLTITRFYNVDIYNTIIKIFLTVMT